MKLESHEDRPACKHAPPQIIKVRVIYNSDLSEFVQAADVPTYS